MRFGRTAARARAAGTPPTAAREVPRPLPQVQELAQVPLSSACFGGLQSGWSYHIPCCVYGGPPPPLRPLAQVLSEQTPGEGGKRGLRVRRLGLNSIF